MLEKSLEYKAKLDGILLELERVGNCPRGLRSNLLPRGL